MGGVQVPGHDIIEQGINIASAATTTLVTAVSGKRVKAWGIYLKVAGTQSCTFEETGGTNLIGLLGFTAREELSVTPDRPVPWLTTTAGQGLAMVTASNQQTSGRLYYTIED